MSFGIRSSVIHNATREQIMYAIESEMYKFAVEDSLPMPDFNRAEISNPIELPKIIGDISLIVSYSTRISCCIGKNGKYFPIIEYKGTVSPCGEILVTTNYIIVICRVAFEIE